MKLRDYYTIIAFIIGVIIGLTYNRSARIISSHMLENILIFLMVIIGFYVSLFIEKFSKGLSDPRVIIIVSSTLMGGTLAGIIGYYLVGVPVKESIAISISSGWYSFAAGYITVYDPLGGLIAFISNLIRETFTIVAYPLIARVDPLLGITLGGATTMDTSLGVITRIGGPRFAGIAFAHGLIITLIMPFLLPLIYP